MYVIIYRWLLLFVGLQQQPYNQNKNKMES